MKLSQNLFAFLMLFISLNSYSFNINKNFTGFVKIEKKELYVDYSAPKRNHPTVVLLNGLTYSTVQWDAMTIELKKLGLGVVRYDMDGMGKTLLKYLPKNAPYTYQDQVDDLDQLLTAMNIKKPYNIVGLSYGGGVAGVYAATFPQNVKNVFLMAPYTEALKTQDSTIRNQILATRAMYPFNPYSDDDIYDYFLKQTVYTTYPLSEPIVLENPYKLEAVFRLTQGIRKLRLSELSDKFPKHSIHLLIAELDQYIPRYTLNDFWNAIPQEAQASYNIIPLSEHKIPESRPIYASELINKLISQSNSN